MNTPERKSFRRPYRRENAPVYLTPEEILAQIPEGVNTALYPWNAKLTQEDMDILNEITRRCVARKLREIAEGSQDRSNRQEQEDGHERRNTPGRRALPGEETPGSGSGPGR